MSEKFLVIEWNTDKVMKEFDNLSAAKKYCKSLGHEPKDKFGFFTSYPPIAFVGKWDDEINQIVCVYNPRYAFEKV
jgi:hypothetical protein